MSKQLAEGMWPATALSASYGENDKGALVVRINARIDDGPSKGSMCTYEDEVTTKSSLYIARSCRNVGWRGGSLSTLAADVKAWIAKTGGKTTVEVKHIEIKRGKKYDDWIAKGKQGPAPIWDKVNSVGRGPKPLKEASKDVFADADAAMREAVQLDGGAPPEDDVPHAGETDDRIPFATVSTVSLGEIAKVLL